ncbi:integrase [Litorimonas haliclonae]
MGYIMSEMRHLDQYLKQRKGRWYYVRRVPLRYAEVDKRRLIKSALKTSSREVARARRDALAEADDLYWSSLASSQARASTSSAVARYRVAKARAFARGYIYTPVEELSAQNDMSEVIDRLRALESSLGTRQAVPETDALLGTAPKASTPISEAFELYCNKISIADQKGKSPDQRRNWRKVKARAVKNFIRLRGDKPMAEIDRIDGQAFFEWWGAKVDPKDGSRPRSGNSVNKDLTNLRILFRSYWSYEGEPKRDNPFDDLRFKNVVYKDIPPFSVNWLQNRILAKGALDSLNEDARFIIYAMIETGCRPSEIANLRKEHIILDHDVPHLKIRPTANRKLKSKSARRDIPPLGVSLEAMTKRPNGFPRYRDKGSILSQTLMNRFKAQGLFETLDHRIYSFRHAFEKRILEADIDYGLRCILMGHHNTRPSYGDGGSLEYRRDQMSKFTLSKAIF